MLKMNLQTFAEGEGDNQPKENMNSSSFKQKVLSILQGNPSPAPAQPEAGQQVPASEAPAQPDNVSQGQPPAEGNQAPQQEVQSEPPVQEQQPPAQGQQTLPVDSNGLFYGKFKTPEDVINAYGSLESMNTRTRQELAQEREKAAQLEAMLQQIQSNSSEGSPQGGEGQAPEIGAEDFMDQFYNDPQTALKDFVTKLLDNTIKPQIEPLVQKDQAAARQAAWNERVGQFASAHDDFGEFKDDMQNILNAYPELGDHPQGLDFMYQMAKGNRFQRPDDMLKNEEVLNRILNDENITQKIITNYLQGVNKGATAPAVIAGQPGGDMQITPENKPRTMEEAKAAARRLMMGNR